MCVFTHIVKEKERRMEFHKRTADELTYDRAAIVNQADRIVGTVEVEHERLVVAGIAAFDHDVGLAVVHLLALITESLSVIAAAQGSRR